MPNDILCILGLIYDRKSSFGPHLACFLTLLLSTTFLVKAEAHTSSWPRRMSNAGQQSGDSRPLELGLPIERALTSGESHSYQIALAADQYLQVEVAQRGVNVIVAGFDPTGKKLTEADSARGTQGSELLTFIADVSGNYRIHISAAERNVPPGRYEIKIIELRGPTADERYLEEARRLSEESRNLRQKGKYDEALRLAERALAIREKILGPDHRDVADSLHALASLYDDKSDYVKAEPLDLRALAIREKTLGLDHPDVAKTLNNLAWIYGVREDYAKAESLYRRALAIQEKALGANHPEVASTLNDLALLYYEKGDYDQSILTNQRVLSIREEMLGPDDAGVAKALNNLALVYVKKGDYAKAESLYQHALPIWEKALGRDHPEVATVLHNLARVYLETGEYTKSLPLYQRALAIREKALGPDHLDVAQSLNNLGMLYDRKGDYAQAEPLHLRALAIQEKRLGPEHPYVAVTLTNLARLYENLGDYGKAEPLYQRALAIREKALGPTHLDVGESLNNLGQLYLKSKKDDARAESLFQRSLEVIEKALGSDYAGVAVPLSNLGAVYERKGDDKRAEQYYQRALAIRESAMGLNHPDVAQSLNSLARLYRKRGDMQKALFFLSRSNEVRERSLSHNLPLGSERQKLDYLKLFSADMDEALSLHAQLAPRDTRALRLAFTILLRRKGRALDAMSDSIASLRSRSNPQDQALFGELFEARSRLAAIALRGPDKNNAATYPSHLKQLEDQVDKLEAEVSARSAEFRAQSQPITLEAIRALLPNGTALIEFAFYRVDDAKTESQEQSRYAAYVLVAGGPAQWVDLGEADPIDRAVAAWRSALRDPQRADAKPLARALDERVMQPVRALLGPSQHLLISADGSLNVIPFAALVDEQNRYLVERFSITYLTSGRDLLRLQVARNSRTGPVVVADPAFGEPATILSRGGAAQTSKQSGNETAGRAQIDYSQLFFGPLPGVADEVRALKQLLPQASFLTRERATKAALKQVRGPSILHIATHGFFLQDIPSETADAKASEREKVNGETRLAKWAVWTENPLLRSGLALAGANQGRSGDDNGVLTALEASGLDLWGTKLVVLSACDTGLGEVKSGEGVYGLRRALVLAGAESQMMSLWPVSDRSTSDLMVGYYKALIRGQGRDEALRQVQLQMLRSKSRANPYYWASFIQSGEWANLEGKR
jgi:CHAT domain-containing protein/Tfp pilus assembly protein PilF